LRPASPRGAAPMQATPGPLTSRLGALPTCRQSRLPRFGCYSRSGQDFESMAMPLVEAELRNHLPNSPLRHPASAEYVSVFFDII
jgi:hypothetical protein